MVFIAVQHLVEIGIVALKIYEFQYYASLASKCTYWEVLGGKNRVNFAVLVLWFCLRC